MLYPGMGSGHISLGNHFILPESPLDSLEEPDMRRSDIRVRARLIMLSAKGIMENM
jgi:hypothetical protein